MSREREPIDIIDIKDVGADSLADYAEIPIAFEVMSVFRLDPFEGGLGGMRLVEERTKPPYWKDYDALDGDARPDRWSGSFDVSDWGIFLAYSGGRRVGGAAVAFNSPEWELSTNVSVLADIRVLGEFRRRGLGTKLFLHAAEWSRNRKCRRMKIETQNVNVPACQFYRRMGCELVAIDRHAYAGSPQVEHEVMLTWSLNLSNC